MWRQRISSYCRNSGSEYQKNAVEGGKTATNDVRQGKEEGASQRKVDDVEEENVKEGRRFRRQLRSLWDWKFPRWSLWGRRRESRRRGRRKRFSVLMWRKSFGVEKVPLGGVACEKLACALAWSSGGVVG